ncbi:MAG TPA: hypothetical protein VFS43_46905 [Polyangiaceae bacterium]|nr:hypothetical protein [Polyangiaceae bacterium]
MEAQGAETALSARRLGERLRVIRAARLAVVFDYRRAAGAADAKGAEPSAVDSRLSYGWRVTLNALRAP